MRYAFLMAIVSGLFALATGNQALADGCFVWHGGADLREPNQRAIIGWDGKTETMILAVKYEGEPADFAWLVPLPAKPEVKAIDADKDPFAEISICTQIRERYGIEGSRGPAETTVEVLDRKVVGVYDIAVLAAKDPKALADWLGKNGYAFPDKGRAVLEHYTKKDWVYAAMRIDPKHLGGDKAAKLRTGELQPIRFTFASKEMVYPLKVSSINAGPTEVLLYLVADAPMVLASGPAAKGMEVDTIVPRFYLSGNRYDPTYGTLQTVSVKELPLTWEALGLEKEAARHLCKYKAIYGSDGMTDDLVFKAFEPLPYWKARLEKAKQDTAPEAEDKRRQVCQFLAAMPQTDDPAFQTLAEDEDWYVREVLAANPRALPAQLKALAADKELRVRRSLLTNPALPADIRDHLATDDPEFHVRMAVAAMPLPAAVQQRVAKDPQQYVRHALAGNPAAKAEVLALLLKDEEPTVRQAAATNASLPADLQATLADNSEAKVRAYVAMRDQTGPDLLTRLAKDSVGEVRLNVARNLKTPVAVLEQLASDENADVRASVAIHNALPQATCIKLAADPEVRVRQSAATRPLPEDVLRRLAADTDSAVRRSVAVNPVAGAAILTPLASDKDKMVRCYVAANPFATEEILATLAKDADVEVRDQTARSAKASPATLAALAQDKDVIVLLAVANNPKTPAATVMLLAEGPVDRVWGVVAHRADATPELLRVIAKHSSWALYSAVENPKAPVDLLREGAKDSGIATRQAVARNPNTPDDVLRTLLKDTDLGVIHLARENLAGRAKP
jgi:hypothetical protein